MNRDDLSKLFESWGEDAEFAAEFLQEELINRVALRVQRARAARGMSQGTLAELIGTQQPAIARIESGEANLTLRTLAQLAFALGCEPDHLVGQEKPPFVKDEWVSTAEVGVSLRWDLSSSSSYGSVPLSAENDTGLLANDARARAA